MNLVVIIKIRHGKFWLSGKSTSIEIGCEPDATSLARLLREIGFNPSDPNHILTGSSSLDFPEEDEDFPKGVQPRGIVHDALTSMVQSPA